MGTMGLFVAKLMCRGCFFCFLFLRAAVMHKVVSQGVHLQRKTCKCVCGFVVGFV
jgi:hypothetical protein